LPMVEYQKRRITNTGDAQALPVTETEPLTEIEISNQSTAKKIYTHLDNIASTPVAAEPFYKGRTGQTPCNAGVGGTIAGSGTLTLANVTVGAGKVRYVSAIHYSEDQLGVFKLSIAGAEVLRISVTINTSHSQFSSSDVHRFEKPWKVAATEAILFQYTNGNATATNVGGCVEMWEETA